MLIPNETRFDWLLAGVNDILVDTGTIGADSGSGRWEAVLQPNLRVTSHAVQRLRQRFNDPAAVLQEIFAAIEDGRMIPNPHRETNHWIDWRGLPIRVTLGSWTDGQLQIITVCYNDAESFS